VYRTCDGVLMQPAICGSHILRPIYNSSCTGAVDVVVQVKIYYADRFRMHGSEFAVVDLMRWSV